VNRDEHEEYPMLFMPSYINSHWGVVIGLLLLVVLVVAVWRPFSDAHHDDHHHDLQHDSLARRHGSFHHQLTFTHGNNMVNLHPTGSPQYRPGTMNPVPFILHTIAYTSYPLPDTFVFGRRSLCLFLPM